MVWSVVDKARLGRRKLMLFAAAGQCACMAILAGTVYDGSHASGIVATVMLFLFNFFFGVGLLAIPWLCTLTTLWVTMDLANDDSARRICPAVYSISSCGSRNRYKLYVMPNPA